MRLSVLIIILNFTSKQEYLSSGRKPMAKFLMRKLIMAMMLAFIILILLEVQAIDSTPASPFFNYIPFSSCLEEKFENCKSMKGRTPTLTSSVFILCN